MTEDIPLSKCLMETTNGIVTCSISKAKFAILSDKGVKPTKVIFEIE